MLLWRLVGLALLALRATIFASQDSHAMAAGEDCVAAAGRWDQAHEIRRAAVGDGIDGGPVGAPPELRNSSP